MEKQRDSWWARQDLNLQPDRYEQPCSWRNPRNSANRASFASWFAQGVSSALRRLWFGEPESRPHVLAMFFAYVGGWRVDLDGWYVRARRATDPTLHDRPDLGFTEESAVAVRSAAIAVAIDGGTL